MTNVPIRLSYAIVLTLRSKTLTIFLRIKAEAGDSFDSHPQIAHLTSWFTDKTPIASLQDLAARIARTHSDTSAGPR